MKLMNRQELMRLELEALTEQHKRLDREVDRISMETLCPPIELQRLKKKKLCLRDKIAHLRDSMSPDIIA